jgi:hypothetical protein
MQTFMPHPSFRESAEVLDNKRLGKQRSECKIILKTLLGTYKKEGRKGWPHHPATKMWAGYEKSLWWYTWNVCLVWRSRGYDDTVADWLESIKSEMPRHPVPSEEPPWFGDEAFHLSHRSNLIRKDPNHYRHLWPDIPDDLPYVWPV